ncbi:GGDEF domain-containing protein [Pseudomonas brenneri]|uniref:diguanylate cyclase n=2 Tax=Pseudomonas brenneri TaxID=129817 RepID=A0A5B2V4K5_9PSED|nr:GGDEF domain-containing protein [Pseudomonas brenneri]KAA2233768.1 GGDEF domain-containing protein [Pseudomonas brenneri]TWR81998.1 GGDEF domain-containing protein [Pseudomonas brenneri]
MMLHIPTLLMVAVFVFCLMGLLTVHTWRRVREPTLGYLGVMLLLASLGTALIVVRGIGMDFVALILGNVVLLLSAAMNWTAMRVFVQGKPYLPGILAGPALWLLMCLIPQFYGSMSSRVSLYSLLAAGYGVLSALELWRHRQHLEVAYLPAMGLMVFHTTFYCVRAVIDPGMPIKNENALMGESVPFFSFMLFESMLYAIGIAYVTLAMVKERAELKFKAAAFSDVLTGIGNRRAFMLHGEQLLADSKQRGQTTALLLCDLDYFKRLNDSFGHPMGDQALIAFSQLTATLLRKHDLFARIGGEEFACLLQGTDEQGAIQVAERIRQGFASLDLLAPGFLSVSIGIVTTTPTCHDLSRLLSQADQALYRAKDQGRNRVQTAICAAL